MGKSNASIKLALYLGCRFALKEVSGTTLDHALFELVAPQKLKHPHIVVPFAYVALGLDKHGILMPLAERDLKKYTQEMSESDPDKKFSVTEIYRVVMEFLIGLSFMHTRGFLHRDIKPHNVFMFGKNVKIGDFGQVASPSWENSYGGGPLDMHHQKRFQRR